MSFGFVQETSLLLTIARAATIIIECLRLEKIYRAYSLSRCQVNFNLVIFVGELATRVFKGHEQNLIA